MNRKLFIKRAAGATLVAVPLVSMLSCADSEPDPDPNKEDCLANGTDVTIGNNHSHSITVSKADVSAGTEKTYSIQGSSAHNHEVIVSASDFTKLKNNQSVQVMSGSGGGHTHTITINCAS